MGYSAQPTDVRFRNATPIVPGPFERGIWAEVEDCLHSKADMDAIMVSVADSIIDESKSQLLWGVYAWVDWPGGAQPTVVVDQGVRYSTRVWSHEFVHVIAGVPDGDWHIAACTLPDGPYFLPVRPLVVDSIAELE